MTIWTIGHSNRTGAAFLELLAAHRMQQLIDVRTIPRSRRNPQFAIDELPQTLHAVGIEYVHMPALGGLRHPRPDSINTAWRNNSFRGYADYMQTSAFESALEELMAKAGGELRTVIMCAESVPWRCHRSLIADALVARGVDVRHIIDQRAAGQHAMTSFSRVVGRQVTYPGLI